MANTTLRATCWSVTINNPTPSDVEAMNLARQKGWKIDGQLEKGEEGTPHYQLRVMTPQVRFSALKKAFPRGHIEAARDPVALGKYVAKEETRLSELPEGQDAYPSLSKLWVLIYQHYNTGDKDGWNYLSLEEGQAEFYNEKADDEFTSTPLVVLDRAVRSLITQGYHVESIAANPSTRSMWKLYNRELMCRSHNFVRQAEQNAVQTDRQTDSVNSEQEVIVPTITTNDGSEDDKEEDVSPSCPPPPPPPSGRCEWSPRMGKWIVHAEST